MYDRGFWRLAASRLLLQLGTSYVIRTHDLVTSLGGSADATGALLACFAAGSLAGKFLFGVLARFMSFRQMRPIGSGLVIVGLIGAAASDSVHAGLYAAYALFGIGTGGAIATQVNELVVWVPAGRRAEAVGIVAIFGTAAMAAGTVVSDLVLGTGSAGRQWWLLSCLFSAIVAGELFLGATTSRERQLQVRPHRGGQQLEFWPIVGMVLLAALFGTVSAFSNGFIPVVAAAVGIRVVSPYYVAMAATQISMRVLCRRTVERRGRRVVLIACGVGLMAYAGVIGVVTAEWQLVLAGSCFGAVAAFCMPVLVGWSATLMRGLFAAGAASFALVAIQLGRVGGSAALGRAFESVSTEAVAVGIGIVAVAFVVGSAFTSAERKERVGG